MRRIWLALLLIIALTTPVLGQPTGPLSFPQPIIFTGGTSSGIGGSTFAAEFSGPVTIDAGSVVTVNGTFAGPNAPVSASSNLTFTGNDIFQTGTLTLNDSGNLILQQTTANYTITWNNPGSAVTRALTIVDPGVNGDTFAFINATQTITNKTYKEGTNRTSGLTITGGATGNPATLNVNCAGSDTNCNLNLVSKGTGLVQHNGTTAANSPAAQAFTASGTYTTPATATALWVRCVGGGGGGAAAGGATSSGGGGGSGGYSEAIITAPAASYTVTIGAGGASGAAGTATTWGAVLTDNGGAAGSGAAGGAGGTAAGGFFNLAGDTGGQGQNLSGGDSGAGGVSPWGGAGQIASNASAGQAATANSGSGGSGGAATGTSAGGGAGGSGQCLVVAF